MHRTFLSILQVVKVQPPNGDPHPAQTMGCPFPRNEGYKGVGTIAD